MPAALIIPALIAGGATVASAAISARSAGKAADQEAAGAQKSLDLQTQMYNQSRSDYAPYRAAGAAALPQLAAYASAPVVQHNAGRQGYSPGYQPGMTLAGMTQTMGVAPTGTSGPTPQPSGAPGGAMVTLVDDHGVQRQVPAALAQHYLAQGARQVS